MPFRHFSKGWLVTFLVFILVLIIAVFIFVPRRITQTSERTSSNNRAFPTELVSSQLARNLSIIYKVSTDEEWRTVIYDHGKSGQFKYPKIGTIFSSEKPSKQVYAVVGLFDSWESIPGSKDKYVVINESVDGNYLRKVRVAAERTGIGVENLNNGNFDNPKKYILSLPDQKLNNIIKKGDAIVVTPRVNGDSIVQYDSEDNLIAAWVIVRRKDGLEAIADYL